MLPTLIVGRTLMSVAIKSTLPRCITIVQQTNRPSTNGFMFAAANLHQSSRLFGKIDDIKEIIEDKIRPTIQEDGGDIEFVAYENNIVKVRLQGACRTCPSSVITLKNGVRSMLQYHLPEIIDVEQVEEDE